MPTLNAIGFELSGIFYSDMRTKECTATENFVSILSSLKYCCICIRYNYKYMEGIFTSKEKKGGRDGVERILPFINLIP